MSRPPQSRCIQWGVGSLQEAISTFSTKSETGEIPLVLIPAHRKSWNFWITVPTGVFCLGQYFGKDAGIADVGASFKPPGYRIAYVVTMQSCTYTTSVKECPTQDNVRVSIDVVMVFSIREPGKFVYKLGAVHFDQLLKGAVDEGIRLFVREQTHQTVRSLRGNRAEAMLTHLSKKFETTGVVFSNCVITSVELPDSLNTSLEHTTEMKKAMEKSRREQEYEIRKIEQESEMTLQELVLKHNQVVTKETGKKQGAQNAHKQAMVKTEEALKVAMIEAGQDAQVKKMELTASLDRARTNMERMRVETISKAEAEAETKRVLADNDYYKRQAEADAERERLLGEAESIKLDADAEAKATQHLTHKRKHLLDMREKDVIMKLAQKANFNLVGKPGDSLVDAVMTGSLEDVKAGGGKGGSWFK